MPTRQDGNPAKNARIEFGFELQTEGASTMDITTIGFDLAKTVFQVHGADAKGRPVLRRKLRRGKVLAQLMP